MKSPFPLSRHGNALVVALIMSGILASMAAATTLILQKRFRQAHQTAAWEEAMLAAEAGVDLAINELRTQLYDPGSAFQGWETQNPDGSLSATAPTGLVSGTTAYYTSTVFLRTNEGGQRSWCEVQIEAPTPLIEPNTKEQWYRVRSLGIAEVPGGGKVAGDKEDIRLRKLDLKYNRRTGQSVNGRPQATRMVEVLVKPVGTFRLALLAANQINMNNHNIVVDSYDSRDPSKSTNAFYDPAKRQNNGDIATNGLLISAGSAHIYGDAATNGGTVLNSSNVTGEIRDDFFQELFPVTAPVFAPEAGSPTSALTTTVLAAAPGNPANYLLSTVTLAGTEKLTITGAADGSPTYATVVVSGDIKLSGQSQIILQPGVNVRLFVKGNADITGQGVSNPGAPLQFQLYGCDPASATGGTSNKTIKVAGNGGLRACVYAPTYDITLLGGGVTDSIYGSFVGYDIGMTGVQSVHYDEALGSGGLVSDYKVANWFEDTR